MPDTDVQRVQMADRRDLGFEVRRAGDGKGHHVRGDTDRAIEAGWSPPRERGQGVVVRRQEGVSRPEAAILDRRPVAMRSIGSVYSFASPDNYFEHALWPMD